MFFRWSENEHLKHGIFLGELLAVFPLTTFDSKSYNSIVGDGGEKTGYMLLSAFPTPESWALVFSLWLFAQSPNVRALVLERGLPLLAGRYVVGNGKFNGGMRQ
jgi:hypothetical protein